MSAPYQAIRAADGHLTLGANTDELWAATAGTFGHPEWSTDPRLATNGDRLANRNELIELLEFAAVEKPVAFWVDRLRDAGVPAGPVYDYEEAFDEPHARAREMVVKVDHPDAGEAKMIGIPIKLSETPGSVRLPPPRLGEHTSEILGELGHSDADIEDLASEGAVRCL